MKAAVLCAVLACTAVLSAQARSGKAEPQNKAAVQTQEVTQAYRAANPEAFSYNPGRRRDPFVTLISRPSGPGETPNRPATTTRKRSAGLQGLKLSEIVLRGVIHSRSMALALVIGSDGKTYIVHVGDQLYDGVVRAITNDSIVVLQEVDDPLSLVKQREVRKMLRVVEEVK